MAAEQGKDLSGALVSSRKGKFHNGWTNEQEDLMSKWADIAACYRWLHDRCEKQYSGSNMAMTIPVIILSTLTGTASVGLSSIVGDDADVQKYAQFAIGGVSLIAGILTTLGNFFKYAQLSESNRVAGIAWGKFQRQIAVELSLHPNDRLDSMDFIKICRAELDRLIEQSPPIPDRIIQQFLLEFKDLPDLKRPDICKGIEHTEAYKDKSERLKILASDAALMLKHKKKLLRDEVLPDIDMRLEKIMDSKISELRAELSKPASRTGNGMSSKIDAMAPRMIQRSISAYEPDWKRLISYSSRPKPSSPSRSTSSSVSSGSGNEAFPQNVVIDVLTEPVQTQTTTKTK